MRLVHFEVCDEKVIHSTTDDAENSHAVDELVSDGAETLNVHQDDLALLRLNEKVSERNHLNQTCPPHLTTSILDGAKLQVFAS